MTVRLRLLSAAVCAALGLSAPAAANPVSAGSLGWTQANVFDGNCDATDVNCTFLGFVTANGEATAQAPATGGPVTPSSPRGADKPYTFAFAGTAGGVYDPTAKTGALEYDGLVRFRVPVPGTPAFTMTLDDPQVILDGTTGQLRASGVNADTGAAYDRSRVVFDLDLSNATRTRVGQTVTINGIYPRVANEGYAFPTGYGTPGQDDRVPPTFGSITLTIRLGPNVSVAPAADVDPLGQTLTVSGTDTSASETGLYIFLSPASRAYTDQNAAPSGRDLDAFTWLQPQNIVAGAFSTTITAKSPFLTGGGQVDCALVPCVVRTIAAHYTSDRSQDTVTPVTFAPRPTVTATPTPAGTPAETGTGTDTPAVATVAPTATVTPTATPSTVFEVPSVTRDPKPRIGSIGLTRERVAFTLSRAARTTVTIKRNGKTARRVSVKAKKGRNVVRFKQKLRSGRYRVAVVPKNGVRKAAVVRLGAGT